MPSLILKALVRALLITSPHQLGQATLVGWLRNTGSGDRGSHTVCAVVTAEFLRFSREHGKDLSTPRPGYGFLGLVPGNSWCLCAPRRQEALEAGCAPEVMLEATYIGCLKHCALEDLERYATQR